jgi:hypothetical protein
VDTSPVRSSAVASAGEAWTCAAPARSEAPVSSTCRRELRVGEAPRAEGAAREGRFLPSTTGADGSAVALVALSTKVLTLLMLAPPACLPLVASRERLRTCGPGALRYADGALCCVADCRAPTLAVAVPSGGWATQQFVSP